MLCTLSECLLCSKLSVTLVTGSCEARNVMSGLTQSPEFPFNMGRRFAWPKYTVEGI